MALKHYLLWIYDSNVLMVQLDFWSRVKKSDSATLNIKISENTMEK